MCLRVRQRLFSLLSFWFLFSLVSFCLPACLSLQGLSRCWFRPSAPFFVLFASVSSSFSPVRLLRLEFRTLYSLVGCSDFSWTSVGVLPWILASPFLSFVFPVCLSSGVSASVRQWFSCLSVVLLYRIVCCYMWLYFFFSPFGSFALASGLRCLPCSSFAWAGFSRWVFYPLPAFVFGSFPSESR